MFRFAQERNILLPTTAHIVVIVENQRHNIDRLIQPVMNDRIGRNSLQGVRLHPLIGQVTGDRKCTTPFADY